MLEPPPLPTLAIAGCLRDAYCLVAREISFLPLGADLNTAVYRVVAGGEVYFLKLRGGAFDPAGVEVPRLLSDHGVTHIIPPLPTGDGRLWATLGDYTVILYPFVEGEDGYTAWLTDAHWVMLGATVRQIHDVPLPAVPAGRLPRESYGPRWRDTVRTLMNEALEPTHVDALAAEAAAFLRDKRSQIGALLHHTEMLVTQLIDQPSPLVLCHADLHAGNVHITPDGRLFIVDWDTLLLAPRERDLMVPGGSQGYSRPPDEEEALFYEGYGPIAINAAAVAYYRGARILEDIAVAGDQLLHHTGGEDRAQEFVYLQSNFAPGGTLAAVYRPAPAGV
jgi:spectinomycin phosphotransferase